MRCLSAVSDTESVSHENIQSAMYRVIQILGSTDLPLVRYATGFLCNVAARNRDNKAYLCENKAIENLMRVLEVLSSSTQVPTKLSWIYQEIFDNTLLAISNLTSNYNVVGYIQHACRQVFFMKLHDFGQLCKLRLSKNQIL
uniref:Uncharacterized protein n=1 Tax=Acrobeloides nanus TaxID=290746 RepID=A0A914D8V1_9BILA